MRHHLHTEVEIDAPVSVVWAVLTDLPSYADWNPFIIESAGEVSVGAELVNRMQPPGGRTVTFKPEVTEVKPNQVFEWLGRLGIPGIFDGRHRFELHTTETGGTRLVHSEAFSGVLVRPFRRSLDKGTVQGFEHMNEALKQRAEARVAAEN